MQFFQSSLSILAIPSSGRRENFAKVKPKIHLRKSNFIFFSKLFLFALNIQPAPLVLQNLCPSFAGAKLHLLSTPTKLFRNFFQRKLQHPPQYTINQQGAKQKKFRSPPIFYTLTLFHERKRHPMPRRWPPFRYRLTMRTRRIPLVVIPPIYRHSHMQRRHQIIAMHFGKN